MTLTAIDPGKKALAWAHFDGSSLIKAGLSRFPKDAVTWDMNLAEYACYHALQVPPADVAVLEGMFQYPPGPQAKLTPKAQIAVANDLLQLQAIGGIVAGKVGDKVILLTAAEWKGQVDKSVTQHRLQETLDLLELTRLQACLAKIPPSMQHNTYDAVALGLTYLGRMRK